MFELCKFIYKNYFFTVYLLLSMNFQNQRVYLFSIHTASKILSFYICRRTQTVRLSDTLMVQAVNRLSDVVEWGRLKAIEQNRLGCWVFSGFAQVLGPLGLEKGRDERSAAIDQDLFPEYQQNTNHSLLLHCHQTMWSFWRSVDRTNTAVYKKNFPVDVKWLIRPIRNC